MNKRPLISLAGVLLLGLSVPVASTVSAAPTKTSFTTYAYESDTPYQEPTCSPSWDNCRVYEFFGPSDLAPVYPATVDDFNGSVDVHGFDYFTKTGMSISGTLALTFDASPTTWTGPWGKTLKASTGTFSLDGSDGSRMTGTITFIADGIMRLDGVIRS